MISGKQKQKGRIQTMFNQIHVCGRFTRDPALKFTHDQVPVVSFTVACDRDHKSGDTGERKTDFIDCVAWRALAEFISENFHKGSLATVLGRLQMRDWVDKTGEKRRSAEISVEHIYFAGERDRWMPETVAVPDEPEAEA